MSLVVFEKQTQVGEVLSGLGYDDLRDLAKHKEQTTQYGSPCYVHKLRARSAPFTRTTTDQTITEEDVEVLKRVREDLKSMKLLQVDSVMGQKGIGHTYSARLFIPPESAELALMFYQSLAPGDASEEPDFVTVMLPDWRERERRILVDAETGITFVLGSDYYGEIKKSFLRMIMYRAKQEGRLGLHAGSKEVWAKNAKTGKIKRLGMLFFGLSGTGKTSLTCHDFDLDLQAGEQIRVRQDDVVLLKRDGACLGTEGKGFFIKTEKLNREEQMALYDATVAPDAILENIWVEKDGTVDFYNDTLTKNGRAVVQINRVTNADGDIDMPTTNMIFFITRNTLMPPVVKLNPCQAACAFMLGESIKTSAADPNAKGEAVREVGTNPFIVGPKGEEGNRLLELLQSNPNVQSYVLNTGTIGQGPNRKNVKLPISVAIIRAIARDDVDWEFDPDVGLETPSRMGGLDLEPYRLQNCYTRTELREKLEILRQERRAWLAKFPKAHKEIIEALY